MDRIGHLTCLAEAPWPMGRDYRDSWPGGHVHRSEAKRQTPGRINPLAAQRPSASEGVVAPSPGDHPGVAQVRSILRTQEGFVPSTAGNQRRPRYGHAPGCRHRQSQAHCTVLIPNKLNADSSREALNGFFGTGDRWGWKTDTRDSWACPCPFDTLNCASAFLKTVLHCSDNRRRLGRLATLYVPT